jgi:mRNA interferase MazF
MMRGKVYWIDLEPTFGSQIKKIRPCVVISSNDINETRKTIVVIPLSNSAKSNMIAPLILSLDKPCVAVCDQIRAVDKSQIKNEICELSTKEMETIEKTLKIILQL